ncbi:universal stress protein [Arthrobacter sp. B1I2]|uniref:universal stress protein n=1 Tax=Arthrobacter sp. B1I2 TaxID=3042263 RepID=UPI0027815602|nr:universal stress protein [Arthrobacter sp. B1I2]MDQ0733424.1 nucleotide-binding universal stress UspA family protein [Arthrobacter sp. B1I2]
MSEVIIVGVDESKTAKKAAECARDLAAALNAPLHVVSAFDTDRTEVVGSGSERFTVTSFDAAEHVARTVAESLGSNVQVTYSAARGRAADAIIKEALRLDARIIVVGNRRMQGIGRVLGSVANSVAHSAPCDVYIANTYDVD